MAQREVMDALRYAVSQGYKADGVYIEKRSSRDIGGFVFMAVSNIHLRELPSLEKRDIDIKLQELDLVIEEAVKQYEESQKLNNL